MSQTDPHTMSEHRRRIVGVRRGFTLTELLVSIAIIGMLATMTLGGLALTVEQGRERRTHAMIGRLNQPIMARWESYRTRRVPVAIPPGVSPTAAAAVRLGALRELQRLEMPQRWADVIQVQDSTHSSPPTWPNADPVTPNSGIPLPSITRTYVRQYNASPQEPTATHQGAECLYLIITSGAVDESAQGLDQFRSADVGDVDNDGMREFLDGWGNPISFLRWAPGYISELQPDPTLPDARTFALEHRDPFDPSGVNLPPATGTPPPGGYRLTPLIYSPGPDGVLDIWHTTGDPTDFPAGLEPGPLTDPYYQPPSPRYAGGTRLNQGMAVPAGVLAPEGAYRDNITNHELNAIAR